MIKIKSKIHPSQNCCGGRVKIKKRGVIRATEADPTSVEKYGKCSIGLDG